MIRPMSVSSNTVRRRVVFLSMFAVGCLSVPGQLPAPSEPWEGTFYQGDYQRQAIVRGKATEVILCSSEDFQKFLCMSHDDFRGLYAALIEAKARLRECEAK